MDMELQRTQLGDWRPIYENTVCQEETLESIVPDAMPDMVRIVQAEATALLRQKEAVDSSIRVTGTARTAILYIPEGGEVPCALEVNLPFMLHCEHGGVHSDCMVMTELKVIGADAQMLNPRKVLVRVELAARLSVYGEERRMLTSGLISEEEHLQILEEVQKDYSTADLMSRAFTFSDVLQIPPSRPQPERLLYCKARCGGTEAKVIGRKLVAKGQVELTALYWGGGAVSAMRCELPFSQVVETRLDGEGCTAVAGAALTGINCRLREDGEMEVTLDLMLQAMVEHERTLTLMSDLYSTAGRLEVRREEIPLTLMQDRGENRQMVRQMCPAALSARQVLDSALTVGALSQSLSGEGVVTVTAMTYVNVLYLTEEQELCAAAYTVPVSCELPLPEGCRCACVCTVAGESSVVPVSEGLDVRFEVLFSYRMMRAYAVPAVASAHLHEREEESQPRPSVIVRRAMPGERLWDMAKECSSTVDAIRAANGLEGEQLPCGSVLLIPRSR
jgi:hypothetical protein